MDLREKKTRRNIRQAFLTLRKTKPVEKITIRELAELAEISKATFYLHYKDIFDLSDSLQNEVIQSILSSITQPEKVMQDSAAFTFDLVQSFYAHQDMIDVLFSGSQSAVLPMRIEKELRSFLKRIYQEDDPKWDMLFTYQILGGYFVFQEYRESYHPEEITRFIAKLSQTARYVL